MTPKEKGFKCYFIHEQNWLTGDKTGVQGW